MELDVAGLTHVGMKRTHNEDSFLLMAEQRVFCVADGMGGHAAGEIASRIACDELAEFFRMTARDPEATWPYKMEKGRNYDENRLACGIKVANYRIFESARADEKFHDMGTTVATLYLQDGAAYVGHVGDSRVYVFSRGVLKQLTEDHSLLNDYLRSKRLSPEEIENFPHKNVIVRALGMKDSVQVDIGRYEPARGDIFLLCSDGLSGLVTDDAIRETLSRAGELQVAASQLIDLANANGGTDNVTAILARLR